MPTYFDAHSHLNFRQFDEDRADIIAQMKKEGVWTITVGTDEQTSREAVVLAEAHEHLFATVGIHPTDTGQQFDEETFAALITHPKVVAVGECGLDYFRDQSEANKKRQSAVFEAQIAFAHKHQKPLMIHGRPSVGSMDAYEDILAILERTASSAPISGNAHFFVGDVAIAKRFLNLGFTLSFDGPITFTREYDEVVRFVPTDMLLAETDAPFAAPEPYRGKRNEPLFVREVVKALAAIRGEDEMNLSLAVVNNTIRVFDIAV